MTVHPFSIQIEQSELDDLRIRLERTRWPPDGSGNVGWSMGTSRPYLEALVTTWLGSYDWRAAEQRLNELPQFVADADGTRLHFVHRRADEDQAPALLLVHGWPDSFHRFGKVIPKLAGRFHVVAPSLPGFGFSAPVAADASRSADLLATLMTETLGYTTFFAHGGDVGSDVVRELALEHPDAVRGIHLTDVGYATGLEDPGELTEAERDFIEATRRYVQLDGAYLLLQATKPQTLAFALNDSPGGLASWFVSMIAAQAGDEGVDGAFGGRDELLTNIMLHWLTGTAGSAVQTYLLNARSTYAPEARPSRRSDPPAAVALFPREIQFPREWAERRVNVQSYERMPRGGHFAALEVPELLIESITRSFDLR
jgi:pimeloyl-ACP methyl ester carboxylesterase